jgi:hypothetical protein
MARDISDDNIKNIRHGLAVLGSAIDTLATRPAPEAIVKPIADRSITGNAIKGGMIQEFHSTGLRDDATQLTVLINNDGILTDKIDLDTLVVDTNVKGNLTVDGKVNAKSLHVNEITSDVRLERTRPLEFHGQPSGEDVPAENTLAGKGLWFVGDGYTKQFTYQTNPGRFFSTESIELHSGKTIMSEGAMLLGKDSLGPSVRHSSLTAVGRLKNLQTAGDLNIDNMIFWNSDQERLGIRTDQPNGMLTLAGNDSTFIIDPENDAFKFGTFTSNELRIVTDDTARITVAPNGDIRIGTKGNNTTKVSVHGKLGVGVNNVDNDVSIHAQGSIKFANKKFEVAHNYPTTGTYNRGDIVWNDEPNPNGWVGWICIVEGTPGEWRPFGHISKV